VKNLSWQPWFRNITRHVAAAILIAVSFLLARSASAQNEESQEVETIATPLMPPTDSGAYAIIKQYPESFRRSAPFARAYYEFERRAGLSGKIDQDAYMRAYEQAQNDWKRATSTAYKSTSPRPLSNWKNVGVVGSGGASYSAGCTVALAFDPTNPSIMYAGAQGGGVWKSIDHGSSWVPLTDYALPNMTVASIAVDPHNPATLWVGTGECNVGEPNYSGSGLWRSTNGGADWEHINLGVSNIGQSFVKVLVDPLDSKVIFASPYDGSARGLYRSEDGGATWSRVYSTVGGGIVWDLVAGKVNGQQTYYLVDGGNSFSASSKPGVYQSTDDGKTWTKVSTDNFPAASKIGRSVLAVAGSDLSKVYVLMSQVAGGDSLGLMISNDGGTSWSDKQLPAYLFKSDFGDFAAQGWYDICIAVHPSGSPIYIGGVQAFVDYGQGWQIWSGYHDLPKTNPHVDHHVIALDPTNSSIVFNGTDGGLYMSSDAAHTWGYRSSNMVTNRIYRIAFERSNQSAVWAGAQDQGTWRLGVVNDTSFFGGDGFQPIPYPVSSIVMYYELPLGEVHRSKDFHTDGGVPLTNQMICGDNAPWDAPLKMSLVGHAGGNSYDLLYLGRQNLWRSTDGLTFKKVAGVTGNVTAIGLSPINSDVVVVGNAGKVQVTTDYGVNWTNRSTGLPGSEVSSIELTGRDPQFILATFRTGSATHVMVSTNFGEAWTSVSGVTGSALPSVNVESVALDSNAPTSRWYASTDVGVYFTDDAGQHWQIASGLPIVACRDLQIRKDGTVLRVATFGRGVWETSLPLAVDFTSLTATKSAAGTTLKWKVGGDPDGGRFEIERSVGDEVFTKIGDMSAAGERSFEFVDPATASGSYAFRIALVDPSGARQYSNIVELTYGSNALIVHDARPNPMVRGESDLSINYELPTRQQVEISIFNSIGTKVATLGSGMIKEAGSYTEQWDGHDATGILVPGGTYFFEVTAGDAGSYTGRFVIK
jgi:hypothetical protein